MPSLTWASKSIPTPQSAALQTEAVLYPQGKGYLKSQPDSQLILGENLAVMSALLEEYEGKLDLIYADPPFFTNRRYSTRIGRGEDSRKPKEWLLAEGYPDDWSNLDSYLDMLYPRLVMMHRLLSATGTFYLHLDWHANSYARLLLDEIFGAEQLLNEIVWVYHGPSPIRSAFNRKHDTILVYTKSKNYTFNTDAIRQPYDPNTVKTFASSPKAGFGKIPDLERGKVPEDWWYFPVVARLHNERTGYPTQKPEALMERIILASSKPGDIVADFFCGSGTTPLVAARHSRRFLAADASWRAVHTTRKRLVNASCPPFSLRCETHTPFPIKKQSTDEAEVLASPNSICLTDALLEDIDYWEIDPAWDGVLFHSAAQASRPRSIAPISQQLQFSSPVNKKPHCVRLVSVNGKIYQFILDL
jgi:site-specific DNA-methyltransferase (adenine-specific)